MEEKNAFERIYEVIDKIPEGKVASYGQVAALAGNRRWARVVGYALHGVPEDRDLPCHRVVTKEGRISPAFGPGRTTGRPDVCGKKESGPGRLCRYGRVSVEEVDLLRSGKEEEGWERRKKRR